MGFFDLGSGIINYLLAHPTILFSGLLLYIFVFVLSVMFSPPPKGRNPFRANRARKRSDLVNDQKQRDSVLKQGEVFVFSMFFHGPLLFNLLLHYLSWLSYEVVIQTLCAMFFISPGFNSQSR